MKKVLFLIGAMLLGVLNIQPAFAGPSMDQYNTTGAESISIKDEYVARQSFRPSVTTLTEVRVNLKQVSGTINCSVSKYNGSDWDPILNINDQVALNGWNTIDFPDTAVVSGGRYRMELGASNSSTRWLYGTKVGDPDLYSRGSATWGLTPELAPISRPDSDFQFQIWGTNPVEIVEEQTNPGSDKTDEETGEVVAPASTTSSTGEAPAQSTSSIIKPSELKAEYTESAKLSWKASTTATIEGYIIFRSETKGSDYTKIGQTEKAILEYTDATAVAEKTYYYVVRAFSGSLQSANSNEASLAIPATANPIAPRNFVVTSFSDNEIGIAWDKNPETNITSYNISWSIGDQVEGSVSVDANTLEYIIPDLQSNTEYKIELTATNSEGKISSPVSVTQTTKSSDVSVQEKDSSIFWIWSGIALLLLLILLGLLLYRSKKKKQANANN